jgi:hypothetical protein
VISVEIGEDEALVFLAAFPATLVTGQKRKLNPSFQSTRSSSNPQKSPFISLFSMYIL